MHEFVNVTGAAALESHSRNTRMRSHVMLEYHQRQKRYRQEQATLHQENQNQGSPHVWRLKKRRNKVGMMICEAPLMKVERRVQSEASTPPQIHVDCCQNVNESDEVNHQDWHQMAMVKLHRKVLRIDLDDFVEATFYQRTDITDHLSSKDRTQLAPFDLTGQLTPNPADVTLVPYPYPEATRHLFVAWMLSHRSIQISGCPLLKFHSTAHQRSLGYKQKAIQIINHDLNDGETKIGDDMLFNIFCVAVVETWTSPTPQWDLHFRGMISLIELRGGFQNFMQTSSWPQWKILQWLLYSVSAEVTTQSSLLTSVFSNQRTKSWLYQLQDAAGDAVISEFPCPLPLVTVLVDLNIIRQNGRTARSDSAVELLLRLKDLSVQTMIATSTKFQEEWLYIIRIYYASTVIYAISTFSSIALPSWAKEFGSVQRGALFALLPKACELPVLTFSLLWPSIIAGFEAGKGTATEQIFIDKLLATMGQRTGHSAPFHGQAMLQRFWKSNKSEWDDCFDGAYCFLF